MGFSFVKVFRLTRCGVGKNKKPRLKFLGAALYGGVGLLTGIGIMAIPRVGPVGQREPL